jgi:preprotein translocase subunit YajC
MNYLLATTAEQQGGGMGSIIMLVGMYAIIFVALYLIFIRPQGKQRKAQAAMQNALEVGDSVLTTSGFYGVIIDITDDTVIVEFGNNKNCRIPMHPNAIAEVEKAGSAVVKEDAASDKTEEKKEEVKLGKAKK